MEVIDVGEAGKFQHSGNADDGIDDTGVKEREAIMDLVIGLEIAIAKSQIQGQLGADLPVVLDVRLDRPVASSDVLDALGLNGAGIDRPDQIAGVGVAVDAGGAVAGHAVAACGAGLSRVGAVGQGQRIAESAVVSAVGLIPRNLDTEGDVVAALDPLQRVLQDKGVGGLGTGVGGGIPSGATGIRFRGGNLRTAARPEGHRGHAGRSVARRQIVDAGRRAVVLAALGDRESLAPIAAISVLEGVDDGLREDIDVGKDAGCGLLIGELAGCVGDWELGLGAIEGVAAVTDIAAHCHQRELVARVQGVVETSVHAVVVIRLGQGCQVVVEGGKIGGLGKRLLQIRRDAGDLGCGDDVVGGNAVRSQSLERRPRTE